jgi:hypothetical protein
MCEIMTKLLKQDYITSLTVKMEHQTLLNNAKLRSQRQRVYNTGGQTLLTTAVENNSYTGVSTKVRIN